jgi:nitrate reductase delta subunit
MARTLKVLSAVLNYPTAELVQAIPELRDVVAGEGIVAGAGRQALDLLIDDIAAGDLYDLQERYELLIDRTRSLSLHLFEHVHGESRDRGQAMIDL